METLIVLAAAVLAMYLMVGIILFLKLISGSFDTKSSSSTVNLDKLKAEDNRYTHWAAEENAKAAADNRKAAEANLKAEELRLERTKLQRGE